MLNRLKTFIHLLVGAAVATLFVLPIYWAAVASLGKVGAPPPSTIQWWMPEPQWGNYPALFNWLPMWRYIQNSLLVVAVAVPLTLLTASLAGFGLSQLGQPLRRQLLLVSVVWMIIPSAALWLFRFQIYTSLGLVNSLWALIVPAVAATNPLFVLLYYWSFRQIPAELFESARLEGAQLPLLWWRLGLPLARPTTAAVGILSFVFYWSDFIGPVLYIFNNRLYTLPIGVQLVNQMDATNWPYLMTAAMTMSVPIFIVFALFQRIFLTDFSMANLFDKN